MKNIISRKFYTLKNYKKKSWSDSAISITLAISLFAVSFFTFSTIKVSAATPTFTDVTTVEFDIKNLIQTAYDSMSSTVSFVINGVPIAKNFLVTDQSGNIKKPFETKPIFQALPDQQIIDMKTTNYNAYTRFALKSYGINIGMSYTEINGIINGIQITVTYSFTWHDGPSALAGRDAVIDHANTFLNSSEYTSKTSDYEKLKAINNYICNTFQYDYRLFVPAEASAVIYTAYKMITDTGAIGGYQRGMCQAYAMYGYIMLKQAGFEAITIDGTAPTSNPGPHAWNMVKIGGNWYHIDFTWDDPVSGGNPAPYITRQNGAGSVSENYLLRSDTELKINHAWSAIQNGYTYPIASAKWTGTPTIVNVTLPPAPTVKPTAVPTIKVISSQPNNSVGTSSQPNNSTGTSSQPINSVDTTSESSKSAEITIVPIGESPTADDKPTENETYSGELNTLDGLDISGQLVDKDGNPLPNIVIELYNTSLTSTTDSNGKYKFDDIKAGKYKIYIHDSNGSIISELPIEISSVDTTQLSEGTITVKGSTLVMNLMLDGNVLTIRSISSPIFQMTSQTWLLLIIIAGVVLLVLILISLRGKSRHQDF